MGKATAITLMELTADELCAAAARSREGGTVRRLLALGLVLDGYARSEAAKRSGMERQTLRDVVHRCNSDGIDGLKSGPGQPPALTAVQIAERKALVLKGPDPEKDGVVRWRCADLRAEIVRRFAVEVTERTIGKWLRKRDGTGDFKKNFVSLVKHALLGSTRLAGQSVEIWF